LTCSRSSKIVSLNRMASKPLRISFRSCSTHKPPRSDRRRARSSRTAEVAQLAARAKFGDQLAQNRLISLHQGLFVSICARYVYRGMEVEDLLQYARWGFIHAVCNRYDPSRGASVTTYCVRWAEKFVQRATENESSTIRVPVWARTLLAVQARSADPSGEGPDLTDTMRQAQAAIWVRPLDERDDAGKPVPLPPSLVDDTHPGMTAAAGCSHIADRLLALLDPDERAAVTLRIGHDLDFPEIAELLYERRIHDRLKSRQWIKILYSRSISKMRRWLSLHNMTPADFF
jgi:RNA polymerase sigma factor (sigma-70 family)